MLSKEEKEEILDNITGYLYHVAEHTKKCPTHQGNRCTCGLSAAVLGVVALKQELERTAPQQFFTHNEKGGRYLYLSTCIPSGSLKELLLKDSLIAYMNVDSHELFLRQASEWSQAMKPL